MVEFRKLVYMREAHNAMCRSELREKRSPGLQDWQLDIPWTYATWYEVIYNGKIAGYIHYTWHNDVLVELHGFAETRKMAALAGRIMPAILKRLKEDTKAKKCFVTVPENAPQVWNFLFNVGFKLEATIEKAIVHDNQLVNLLYITRDL